MRTLTAVTLSALFASACTRRAAPSLTPEPTRSEAPHEATGPDASVARAPNTPGPSHSNSCAENEPETDQSAALGLTPQVVHEGGRDYHRYPRTDVFLRVRQRPVSPQTTSGALQLELQGPRTIRRDQPIPLQVSFRNASARTMTVIRANDGSHEHMREPFVDLYVEDLATQTVYRSSFVGGRCGMVNQLQATDLVSIPARGSSDAPVAEWAGHLRQSKIPAAGRYRLWAVYRMCSFDRAQGMGTSSVSQPADLFVGRAASNAIELTVQ